MVGLVEDLTHITRQDFKNAGDLVYMIGETGADFNGTEIQKMLTGKIEGQLADFDLEVEKRNQDLLLESIQKGLIESAHDCSEGGLGVALIESCFNNQLGFKGEFQQEANYLFAETPSRFVVSIKNENQEEFESLMGNTATLVGETVATPSFNLVCRDQVIVNVDEAKKLWEEAIPCLMK